MKLLTFKRNHTFKLGIKTDLGVLDIEKAAEAYKMLVPQSIEDVLNNVGNTIHLLDSLLKQALEKKDEELLLMRKASISDQLSQNQKIICVGINYQKHAEESNMPLPEYPLLFNKFDNTVSAHGDVINLPFNSKKTIMRQSLQLLLEKRQNV